MEANTLLSQTETKPFTNWEHADVAGGMMAFIGGLFQGIGITQTFFAGREQKEDLYKTIKEANQEQAAAVA